MTPTSVLGNEAVRERVEQEGNLGGGELRGSLWGCDLGNAPKAEHEFWEFWSWVRVCDLPPAMWPRESYQPLILEFRT